MLRIFHWFLRSLSLLYWAQALVESSQLCRRRSYPCFCALYGRSCTRWSCHWQLYRCPNARLLLVRKGLVLPWISAMCCRVKCVTDRAQAVRSFHLACKDASSHLYATVYRRPSAMSVYQRSYRRSYLQTLHSGQSSQLGPAWSHQVCLSHCFALWHRRPIVIAHWRSFALLWGHLALWMPS